MSEVNFETGIIYCFQYLTEIWEVFGKIKVNSRFPNEWFSFAATTCNLNAFYPPIRKKSISYPGDFSIGIVVEKNIGETFIKIMYFLGMYEREEKV